MFSKRNLPVVLLLLCAGLIVAFRSLGFGDGTPPQNMKRYYTMLAKCYPRYITVLKKSMIIFPKIFLKNILQRSMNKKIFFCNPILTNLKNMKPRLMMKSWVDPFSLFRQFRRYLKKELLKQNSSIKNSFQAF